MFRHVARWLCPLFALLLICAGCGGTVEKTKPAGKTDSSTEGDGDTSTDIKVVEAAALPPLGDPLPPNLDRGRINNLAPPEKWDRLANDSKYVARLVVNRNNPNDLPRIMITAAEATGWTEDVTEENVVEFAAAIAQEKGADAFQEPPRAMLIGDNAYARYVVKRKKGSRLVQQAVLETVFDGRRYALALEVYEGEIPKYRDQSYAVAAGIQFTKPAATP